MRKISEKELKKRGIKLKANDLGRIASSKSSKVLSDASKAIQQTVKALDKISVATANTMAVNTEVIKLLGQSKGGVQKIEIVGGDKGSKQWRVRITGRDKDSLVSELIIEQV